MDADALAELLLQSPGALEQLAEPLPDQIAEAVVVRLKAEADRHWWINANRSLELADLIVHIGRRRDDPSQIAMGLMARGNALMFLSCSSEAWERFEEAGKLFLSAGCELGWARTRIGRLLLSVDSNHVSEALNDAERARTIFLENSEQEQLLRLELNSAIVHGSLGEHRTALAKFRAALTTAERLPEHGQAYLGLLHTNLGHVYDRLGDVRQAQRHHQQARAIFSERNEQRGIALAELNNAHIEMSQGHHRHALQLLHHAHHLYMAEDLRLDAANVARELVECYLILNRHAEARNTARQVIAEYCRLGASYRQALTLVHLATAEAGLGDYEAAETALFSAEPIFKALGATTWTATVHLRRARIALLRGELARARLDTAAAADTFEAAGQQIDFARALVQQGQLLLLDGNMAEASACSAISLQIARNSNVPELRYAAHLLLGHIAQAEGRTLRAKRRYGAATATVDRMQRGLTITLRPGFLEDKGEALRALIALHLRAGQGVGAIEALEHAKSQALLGYLANQEQLRWATDDPYCRTMVNELDQLREEHRRLYLLAHPQPERENETHGVITAEQALTELAIRERRMRSITEQLYLSSGDKNQVMHASRFSLGDLQRRLDDDTLVVEYYDDGTRLWAFSVCARTMEIHALSIGVDELGRMLRLLRLNFDAALARPTNASMTHAAQRFLERLHTSLLGPLTRRLMGRERVVIVPYGALHYLPFHLLYTGDAYLIERMEVVVLPAAGQAIRQAPQRAPGARTLTHTWAGRLPYAKAEGRIVQALFGGELYEESTAVRGLLNQTPKQILHIAAHGEHRLDQPDLSYIELADGQMYADDLLQHDLSYELVTLSACETGRARVAAGDELIGLGRGFLYAGAGALLTSLWRVADDVTLSLLQRFYRALSAGESKAAALRNAQREILDQTPQLHPALWGAFQLVGDAGPLSNFSDLSALEEALYEARTIGAA